MTNEQKTQVAAMNASGLSIDEISAQAEIGAEEVTEFLASREHLKDTVRRLCEEGKSTVEIAEITGISTTTVGHIKGGLKRRKEPTAAATATDSKTNIVQVQNTTKSAESQALRGVNVLGVLECALDNAYGTDAEIMSLRADSEQAHIMFRYGGEAYALSFGLAF